MTKPTPINAQRWALQDAAPLTVTRTSVVCGTDFSEQAAQAVEVAAALAKALSEPLVLVHAVDKNSRTALPADLRDSLCLFEKSHLHEELERLRAAEVEVREDFRVGKPDAVLVEAAIEQRARLLVVSSHGRKPPKSWLLGSVAERAAEASPVPTLVVRAAKPFTGWALGKRRLRVLVGDDLSAQSDAALHWVAWLRQLGPCDVVAAYLEPAAPATGPFDMMPSSIVVQMLAKTDGVQARTFRQHVRGVLGARGVRMHIEMGWGRSDAHLIEIARKERADLIVVGTHQRHGLDRVGHPSVSRGVLHHAPMSVACVPAAAPAGDLKFQSQQPTPDNTHPNMNTTIDSLPMTEQTAAAETGRVSQIADASDLAPQILRLKSILVPIDFSDTSLKALQYATPFAKLFGARLTLLHVVPPPPVLADGGYVPLSCQETLQAAEEHLEKIAESLASPGLTPCVLTRGGFVHDTILRVARETAVDLIILTTHGYTGFKHLLMGSTAENIVRNAPCPVLVVREKEREFV